MNMRLVRALPCTVLAVLALSWPGSVSLAAAGAKGSATLDEGVRAWRDGAGNDTGRVILTLAPGTRGAVKAALRGTGTLKAEHGLIDALTVEVPRAALAGLAHNPNILNISLDAPIESDATTAVAPNGQTLIQTVGLGYVNAPTGSGVGIAIVDSGISPLAPLSARITAFYDFTSGTAQAASASDPYGHGTHVAGLAAGSGVPSRGFYRGIATNAKLIGLRVLDGVGSGYTSNVIAAIEFATTNRAALGIDIINLSLGHPIFESAATDPLVRACEAASKAGIVVVVSAGNVGKNPTSGLVGYGGITSPGNAPSAITVGSADTKSTKARWDDTVNNYSSRGPTWFDGAAKPDIVAPGYALTAPIASTSKLYADLPSNRASVSGDSTPYMRLSGTSMAAPVVSGVVAAMIEIHRAKIWWAPKLTPNSIKAILQYSAIPLYDPVTYLAYDRLTQGTGEVNGSGAVLLASIIDNTIATSSWWASYKPNPQSPIGGQSSSWAQHLVWGSHIVWGDAVYVHETGWETSSTWGGGTSSALASSWIDPNHIVWGDVSVWGNHIVWGNTFVGNSVDGTHIVWGSVVDAQHIVWGDLTAQHIVWGDCVNGMSATLVETYVDQPLDDPTIYY